MLDLSKLLMLDFHYDFLNQQHPGTKSTLAFTDTDSLLYKIETDDIYADMRQHHEHLDLSNYPNDHQIFWSDLPETVKWLKTKNKKIVGKMKDKAGGDAILEFVGLRAKACAFLQETNGHIVESKKTEGDQEKRCQEKNPFQTM